MIFSKINFTEEYNDSYIEAYVHEPHAELQIKKRKAMIVCPGGGYGWLSEREDDFSGRFEKDTDEIEPDRGVLENMDAKILTRALEKLLLRMDERTRVSEEKPIDKINPIIKRPIVPVSHKVLSVLRFMYRRRSAHFDELFEDAESRSEIVAIFYATLELLKAGRLTLQKEIGDITSSNVILNFNMTHKREESEVTAGA